MLNGPFVVCIQGPTASGKSVLAEALARELGAEIVSADSMQIYRGMDIGTAKVPAAQRTVPYHCIDIRDPGEPYSSALFQKDAREAIADIDTRGKQALVCGGTGLYVRAVLDEMQFAFGAQEHNDVRARYEHLAQSLGPERLHELLRERDPQSAACIHPNNVRRVVRALEMHENGESYAQRKQRFRSLPAHYPCVKLALALERGKLYERIEQRVDEMFEQGLVDEVTTLLNAGFRDGLTAKQAIGYKEVVDALDGQCTMQEASQRIKQATRRYAKRQLSWLKTDASIVWLDASEGVDEHVQREALDALQRAREADNA